MSLKFRNEQEFQEWLNKTKHIQVISGLMNDRGEKVNTYENMKNSHIHKGEKKNTEERKIDQEESMGIYIPITLVVFIIVIFGLLLFLGKV